MLRKIIDGYKRYLAWSNSPHHFEPTDIRGLQSLMDKVGRKFNMVSWIQE